MSTLPLIKAGLGFGAALSVVFAADTLSIAVMELVDNVVMALIPDAMDSGLVNPIFWIGMMITLTAAFFAAFPVNRYLIDKGKGHAPTHQYHHGSGHEGHGDTRSPRTTATAVTTRAWPVGTNTMPVPRSPHPKAPRATTLTSTSRCCIDPLNLSTVNTNTLAGALIGFLPGGLTVSIAGELENDDNPAPAHGSSNHQTLQH